MFGRSTPLRRPGMPNLPTLLAACTLSVALCAQHSEPIDADKPEPQPTSTLLTRLKSSRLTLDDATAVAAELRGRDARARLQASGLLRKAFLRVQKDFDKDAHRVLSTCERAAQKLVRARLRGGGDQRVAQLRDEALAVTRGSELSKERIRSQIDPRVDELQRLLLPSSADVLESDATLSPELDILRAQHDELRRWFELYRDMLAGMEMHPDVDKHLQRNPPPPPPGDARAVDDAVALATFTGLVQNDQDQKTLRANEALRGSTDAEELLGTLALNRLRYLLGLRLLIIDPKLSDAARDHSTDMHTLGFFSHGSPVKGKERFGQRAANFGTSASAENIATGHGTGEGAIRGWWYSPGHHKNMLGNHRRTGLGRHETLWTQMFGG